MRLTPCSQITGDRDSISTMASVNSLLTAANSLFAASWHITNNVSAITAQHATIVRALRAAPARRSTRYSANYGLSFAALFLLLQVRSAPKTMQRPAATKCVGGSTDLERLMLNKGVFSCKVE